MTAASNQIIPNGSYNNVGTDFITPYTAAQAIVVATAKSAATGYIAFDGANTRLKCTTIVPYAADAAMVVGGYSGTAGSITMRSSTGAETTGAYISLVGNTHASTGRCTIQAGNASGGKIQLAAQATDGTIELIANSANRWVVEADGDFAGDATSGGDVVFQRAGKGVNDKVAATFTATGTVQGDAAQLVARVTKVTTGASGTGALLHASPVAGMRVAVFNFTGNSIKVYPASGHYIDDVQNTGQTLANRAVYTFVAIDTTHWLRESFD